VRRVRRAGLPATSSVTTTVAALRPTARGLGVAAALVAVLVAEAVVDNPALFVFVAVLGLPLVAAPVLAVSRARRAGAAEPRTMVAPPLVPVDAPCDLILQLANPGDRALPPLGLDRPAARARARAAPTRRSPLVLAAGPARLLRWDAIGARQCGSTVRTLATRRRGVFVVGPLRLWAHDPFALCGVPVATAPPATVVVHPTCAATLLPRRRSAGSPTDGAARAEEVVSQSDDPAGEWSGLRPYVPGDRLHLLSWPAEALYGALLVDEFRPDGEARIRIVLDDRAGVHRRDAFEAALRTLHGLVVDAGRQALDVELVALSGDRSIGADTAEGMVEHLTFLARAGPRRTRVRGPGGATGHDTAEAAVVVTTATARPSLPSLPGEPSVVVAE
jgi:uncharacterized protein (DUF58 family)